MKKTNFPTAQDAEAAFYEALEHADIDAMMEVWSDDEEVVCIHPGGARLSGFAQVRDSWAQMFKSGQRLQVRLTNQVVVSGLMFSIHSLHENILAQEAAGSSRGVVVATNVYMRAGSGWRMVMHHASPAVAARGSDAPPAEPSKVLH